MTGYTLIIIRDQIRHIAEVGLEVRVTSVFLWGWGEGRRITEKSCGKQKE